MARKFPRKTYRPPRRRRTVVVVVLLLCIVVAGGFAAWKLRGPDPQKLVLQAQILHEQGQTAEATNLMAQAVAAIPDDPDVSRLLVEMLLVAGNGRGLEKELMRAREHKIEWPDTQLLLLRALSMQGRYEEVIGHVILLPESPDVLKILGRSQLRLGFLEGASRSYAQVLMDQPADAEACTGLAKIAIRRKAFREAESHLQVLQTDHRDEVDTLLLLGSLRHHLSDYAAAEKAYSKVLDIDPAHRDARIGLARINLTTGNPQKSREWLAPLSPNATVNLIRGMAAHELGELEGARVLYQQSLHWAPDNYSALLHLGYVHRAIGEPALAIQRLGEAHRVKPREPGPLLTLAEIHREAGLAAAVVDTLGELISLHPGWLDGSELIPARSDLYELLEFALDHQPDGLDFQLLQTRWALQSGNLDKALTIAVSLQNHPDGETPAHQLEGDVWLARGDVDKGFESYVRALETRAGVNVQMRLAKLLIRNNRPSEAIVMLRDRIRNQPTDVQSHVVLAIAAQKLGDDTLAMNEFQKVLALEPDNAHALSQLAVLFHREDDQARAIEYIERARQAAPTDAQILSTFGLLLMSVDPHRALSALNLAIELDPTEPRFRLALARALAALGSFDKSREEAEFLLKLPDAEPVAPQARALLDWLDSQAQE